MDALISLLVYVIIVGLLFYLVWWLLGQIGLPEPFNKVAIVIVAIIAFLILLNIVLSLLGNTHLFFNVTPLRLR